jgi:hypothetical protein
MLLYTAMVELPRMPRELRAQFLRLAPTILTFLLHHPPTMSIQRVSLYTRFTYTRRFSETQSQCTVSPAAVL